MWLLSFALLSRSVSNSIRNFGIRRTWRLEVIAQLRHIVLQTGVKWYQNFWNVESSCWWADKRMNTSFLGSEVAWILLKMPNACNTHQKLEELKTWIKWGGSVRKNVINYGSQVGAGNFITMSITCRDISSETGMGDRRSWGYYVRVTLNADVTGTAWDAAETGRRAADMTQR